MRKNGFKSNIGFILASIGSAVGLGNIWSFPYKLAEGGSLFLIFYLLLALFVGIPLLVSELAIGRYTGSGVVSAYKKISPKLKLLGILSVISPCLVMTYYTVVGGYCIRYFLINIQCIFTNQYEINGTLLFNNLSADIFGTALFSLSFIAITYFIARKGIGSGIEKFNKIAMPLLFLILTITMIKSLTSAGVVSGLKYMLISKTPPTVKGIIKTFSSAGEQMLFSLSIAVGTMVTYGSFMNKKQDIINSVAVITFADSAVALMAGLTIIPTAFSSFSSEGLFGPQLLFLTMQNMFTGGGKYGAFFGAMFFMLVIIAAVSSAVAFIEVPISSITDIGRNDRKKSLRFCCMAVFIASLSVSVGGLCGGGANFIIFITEGIIIPLTALFFSVCLGWFCGSDLIISETANDKFSAIFRKLFPFIFKFAAPGVIITVIIGQILYFLF